MNRGVIVGAITALLVAAGLTPWKGEGGEIVIDAPFNWTFFPFMDTLRDAVGGLRAVGLIVAVGLLVVFAIAWGAGRAAGSRGVQSVTGIGFLICLAVAVIIGASVAITEWGANLDVVSAATAPAVALTA